MIAYVTVGSNDIARARRFYAAFLPDLGYRLEEVHGDLSFLPMAETGPDFYVKAPFDGAPARAGNGAMVAFEAQHAAQVRALYAAALAAGGTDDGPPGFRAAYSPDFYVAYLRDPDGNKIALFASEPSQAG